MIKHTITAALTAVALGSGAIAGIAHAQTKVVFGTVTSVTLSLGVIVAAKQLGFFKDEGLEVEIVSFNGTATLLPQMNAKRVQFGYPNPDVMILSRAPMAQMVMTCHSPPSAGSGCWSASSRSIWRRISSASDRSI